MAYEFKLPDLGEGLTEGEVARWLVSEGQEVAEDDPLVEIQTDKTTVEIPSPAAGVVARILVAEGDVVPVGTVLVVIGEDGAARRPAADRSGRRPGQSRTVGRGGRVRATPLVRRLAQELGVELEGIDGTGPAGPRDRGRTCAARPAAGEVRPRRSEEAARAAARGAAARRRAHGPRAPRGAAGHLGRGVRLRRGRPQAARADGAEGVAESLREFPELNARLEGDEIVYLDRYDIGVAVQTDDGLVVPVVRGCDTATVDELAAEVARLAEAARAGTLKPEELRGSTFTVTSAGKLGGLLTTPIVNHPEVAILSVGRVADRPVVRDGEVVVRPVGTIAVTFDHRVIDGARAAEFGLAVIRRLEG